MADEFDKGIEELDREIGMRLRAALDDVEPDEAASARMLTALKDAEAMRKVTAEAAGGEGAHADIRQRATGTGNAAPRPRGRIAVWKVAAPIAAVLIVAAIGFGVASQSGPKAGVDSATNVNAEAVTDAPLAAEGAAADMAEESAMEMEADSVEMAGEAKGIMPDSPAEDFFFVTLSDGTELSVEADEAVNAKLIGDEIAAAKAYDASGEESVPCTVYEYEGTGDYVVVYDDGADGEAYIAHTTD